MEIIEKCKPYALEGFDWLDFSYLPDSKAHRFEIYFGDSQDPLSSAVDSCYFLFRTLIDSFVKVFGENNRWGDFCIDTWDFKNDTFDYSPSNKEGSTSDYLKMLIDSRIEPYYTGFCTPISLKEFLRVTFNCVIDHTAPYGMIFYDFNNDFIFYFHYSGSFGVYYKYLNQEIELIISKAKSRNFEFEKVSDERVIDLITPPGAH